MSQHTTAHAPKRKDVPDPTAVGSTSKKARREEGTEKRHKDKKEKKERSKGKGKAKADAHEGPEGEFCAVKASVVLALSPVFASKPREGAEEMLDSMIMRCVQCRAYPPERMRSEHSGSTHASRNACADISQPCAASCLRTRICSSSTRSGGYRPTAHLRYATLGSRRRYGGQSWG